MFKSWINIAFLGIIIAPIGIFILTLITYLWDDLMKGLKSSRSRKTQGVYPYEEIKKATSSRRLRAVK